MHSTGFYGLLLVLLFCIPLHQGIDIDENSTELVQNDLTGKEYFENLHELFKNTTFSLIDIAESIRIRKFHTENKPLEGVLLEKNNENYEYFKEADDCEVLLNLGHTKSGVYRIWPKFLKYSILVYCDMETEGGGWTVIQRRGYFDKDPVNFYRGSNDYKYGFGNISEEFWLGNEVIWALTNQGSTTLRIEMEDFDNLSRYAQYRNFFLRSEYEKYTMFRGLYSGNAGDSLNHAGKPFLTKSDPGSCQESRSGGWWYDVSYSCTSSNLNGLYFQEETTSYYNAITWKSFRGDKYALKSVEMKLRSY